MIDKPGIKKIIDNLTNGKCKDFFTQEELESIVMSMYLEYKKLGRSDFEFGIYIDTTMSLLKNQNIADGFKNKYLR